MSLIKVDQLVASMLRAAKGALGEKWPEAKGCAEREFTKIGMAIAFIEARRARDQIDEEKARMHLAMQVKAARNTLLALEGIGAPAVESAIHAAMDVVKDTVNTSLGFVLI